MKIKHIRTRTPGSVRDKKEHGKRVQKISMTFARFARFECLLSEFDINGFKNVLRQMGINNEKDVESLVFEHWKHREAKKYAIIKVAKKYIPEEKQEIFIKNILQGTCKCKDSSCFIKFAEEFFSHLNGENNMGIKDYNTNSYQNFLKEVHPIWIFDSSPFGPQNTLTKNQQSKILKKIQILIFPPKSKPISQKAPLSYYNKILEEKIKTDQAYENYQKFFEKNLQDGKKIWQKTKPKQLSQTELIADILETTRSTVRKYKQRLKKWNML